MYAGKFLWSHLGDATLSHGRHTLTITVTGPRARDGRYALAIDAFCLSRVPFHPNGTQLPAIELLPPPVLNRTKRATFSNLRKFRRKTTPIWTCRIKD